MSEPMPTSAPEPTATTVASAPTTEPVQTEPKCPKLASTCHDVGHAKGDLGTCHEIGHKGDEAVCATELDRCMKLCEAAAKSAKPGTKGHTGGHH
jgi:hypothetical protein